MISVAAPGGVVGKRTIPWVVDAYANDEPQKVYARVPGHDLSQGFRDVTYGELAHAVNHVVWWLKGLVTTKERFPVISYLGVNDIRYTVIILAAIKAGYVTMVPSARNSESNNVSLLEEVKCNWFFCSSEYTSRIQGLKERRKPDLAVYTIPTLNEMLATVNKPCAYEKPWDEVRRDPILICHTSGTTSAPKPITLRHQYFAAIDLQSSLPPMDGRRMFCYMTFTSPFVSAFPPFHVGGIKGLLVSSIFRGVILVLPPPDKPANGELLNQILEMIEPQSVNTPPTILEQLVEEPGGLERLSKLDWISSGGGQLSPSVGDQVSKVTILAQFIGSTELGIVPVLMPERGEWNYFSWHPGFKAAMQHIADNMYELVIPKDPSVSDVQCIQWEDIDGDVWRTMDIFTVHPSKPNLWRFHGRTDDVIVLGNGEKFNPVSMEQIIQEHPLVSGAIIVGQGRFQACLIVEPKEHSTDGNSFMDKIWPSIEAANTEGPAHARIFPSHVIVASPEKPFPRVGKGTIARRAAEEEYKPELETLYAENDTIDEIRPPLESTMDLDAIKRFVRACAASFIAGNPVADEDDLFTHGLDSLQASEIAKQLKRGLTPYMDTSCISPKIIYANPRVDSLARYVKKLRDASQDHDGHVESHREARMHAMVEKYTQDLPAKLEPNGVKGVNGVRQPTSLCVVLTGSTGSLGTHLLRVLLQDPKITKVYCLNRAADAQKRHEQVFRGQGRRHMLNPSKVEFFQVEFGHAHFGLSDQRFDQLLAEVDVIVHNAWMVNFNHPLESFEAEHVRSTRHLIDWSFASKRHAHIFLVSSLGSIGNWARVHSTQRPVVVPERELDDYALAQEFGYGESKHVAERILDAARVRSGVPATIFRVGQVAGPTQLNAGEWNRHEYIPALVQTSLSIGCIPEDWNHIDWIPVDVMAQIMVELVHTEYEAKDGGRVNHLVNPNRVHWSAFVDAVQKHYSPWSIKAVPLAEWIRVLKKVDSTNPAELVAKPAVKILDFYEDNASAAGTTILGAHVETQNSVAGSETMAGLDAVRSDWMDIWLSTWNFQAKR